MSNSGYHYSRCDIPSCKKRVVDGEIFCHLHGGPRYQPQSANTQSSCDTRRLAYQIAVEDAVVHIHSCPICALIPLPPAVWKWSTDDLISVESLACDYGQTQITRLQDCLIEGTTIPATAFDHGEKIERLILLIILHFGHCRHCREHRSDMAVWDFHDPERVRLKKVGCVGLINLLNLWIRQIELKRLGHRFAHVL